MSINVFSEGGFYYILQRDIYLWGTIANLPDFWTWPPHQHNKLQEQTISYNALFASYTTTTLLAVLWRVKKTPCKSESFPGYEHYIQVQLAW